MAQKIQEAGGQIIGVSSQDNDEAQKAKEAWKIEYEIVGDPSLVIAKELYERNILTLWVDQDKYTIGDMKGLRTYKEGMMEPGVAAITKDWEKLYAWALIPSRKNSGGATGRVHAKDAMKAIERSLSGDKSLANWVPEYVENPRQNGMMNTNTLAGRTMFKAMMLAKGNFIRPVGLELPEDGVSGKGYKHFQDSITTQFTKIGGASVAMALLARKFPRAIASFLVLYGIYHEYVCEPVYTASWLMEEGSNLDKNVLPRLVQQSKL